MPHAAIGMVCRPCYDELLSAERKLVEGFGISADDVFRPMLIEIMQSTKHPFVISLIAEFFARVAAHFTNNVQKRKLSP